MIETFEVKDLTEHSDHCPIVFSMDADLNDTNSHESVFSMDADLNDTNSHESVFYQKMVWDCEQKSDLLCLLESKRESYEILNDDFVNNDCFIDHCINNLSELIHDISFSVFGNNNAQASHSYTSNTKHNAWSDNNCKNAKCENVRDCLKLILLNIVHIFT